MVFQGYLSYAIGIFISSTATTPEAHQTLNLLIGFGIAGSGFGPILAVVGRATSQEKRSLALGITTAAGSAGQVIGPPLASILLSFLPLLQLPVQYRHQVTIKFFFYYLYSLFKIQGFFVLIFFS